MTDVADRLLFLRKKAKLGTKKDAATKYRIGYEVYKKIESKRSTDPRNLTPDQCATIAKFHRVSQGWLMFGEGSPEGYTSIRLEGAIGAGQEINLFDDNETHETVSSEIAGAEARALEVRGDSMRPLARDGDIIFVGPEHRSIAELIGRECAVLLEDGRRFFKVIENSAKRGRYDLISYNAETIRDVAIHSAGLFLGLRRSQRIDRRRKI